MTIVAFFSFCRCRICNYNGNLLVVCSIFYPFSQSVFSFAKIFAIGLNNLFLAQSLSVKLWIVWNVYGNAIFFFALKVQTEKMYQTKCAKLRNGNQHANNECRNEWRKKRKTKKPFLSREYLLRYFFSSFRFVLFPFHFHRMKNKSKKRKRNCTTLQKSRKSKLFSVTNTT